MTQVWPFWGLAPVPTVVSMIFRPVSVVMVFPCVCAAAGQAAARVAAAIMKRRVTGMGWLFLGEVIRISDTRQWQGSQPPWKHLQQSLNGRALGFCHGVPTPSLRGARPVVACRR